jgi:signal transduction histidine kinase
MKFWEFIKDKTAAIGLHAAVLVLTVATLLGFAGVSASLVLLIAFTYLAGFLLTLLLEYRKKKNFYNNLLSVYGNLDKKNLIAELISPPDFFEGAYLYDMLRSSNKACLEEINRYKFLQEEYREYIELWVHELKNPIASGKLIIQNNPSPAGESILEELEKIESFVEQALYYSRSNTVEKDYLIRKLDLKDLCFGVIKRNARLLIQNNVAARTGNLDFTVFCDAKWLFYILNQLAANSVKYARDEGAWVLIRAEEGENGVRLFFEDNGIGIPANELPRIFDKGFTGSNGRQSEKSTGMGLYIVKKLCGKLGLGIDARSSAGGGTEICITFPKNSMTGIV